MELFTVSFAGKLFVLTFFNSMYPNMTVQVNEDQVGSVPTTFKDCKSARSGEGKFVCSATIDGQKVSIIYSQDLTGAVQASIE